MGTASLPIMLWGCFATELQCLIIMALGKLSLWFLVLLCGLSFLVKGCVSKYENKSKEAEKDRRKHSKEICSFVSLLREVLYQKLPIVIPQCTNQAIASEPCPCSYRSINFLIFWFDHRNYLSENFHLKSLRSNWTDFTAQYQPTITTSLKIDLVVDKRASENITLIKRTGSFEEPILEGRGGVT